MAALYNAGYVNGRDRLGCSKTTLSVFDALSHRSMRDAILGFGLIKHAKTFSIATALCSHV